MVDDCEEEVGLVMGNLGEKGDGGIARLELLNGVVRFPGRMILK